MKSDSLKTIFVHIPKCGGTSVESILFEHAERTPENFWMGGIGGKGKFRKAVFRYVLREPRPVLNRYQTGGLQHLTALQIRHAMGRETFNQYYRFAVVRHPLRRSLSQYRYMRERKDLMEWIGMETGDSFRVFLEKTYTRAHTQWAPQINFVNDHLGNCLVNDVVKLEEIDSRMDEVFAKIGLPPREIPHLNRSRSHRRREEPGPEEKGLIWELYQEDFEAFGYSLD